MPSFTPASGASVPSEVPAGTIFMTARAAAPTGYLLCDGSNVSRATYADLFSAISDTFGVGDGSTTFGLPDLRGRSPVGVGTGDADNATAWTLAEKGGDEVHQLTEAELPDHDHGVLKDDNGSTGSADRLLCTDDSGTGGVHTSTGVGSDTAHNTMHPVLGLNYIIKT